ncbi:hypothetical protein DRE_07458 [Drechslerella stenobrocha 248]|uniref:Cell wall proline rich protein n=1 Tax=Drechslerella stenobrocha 248 TaxID=1043628 RepID=W7HIJ5_9PEZI|nr:hypothetical protein DRE_07458 [Drechslerella stenobrocha 248]
MATASPQFQTETLSPALMKTFVFPASRPSSATPSKRPSSSSALLGRTSIPAAMPSPTYSDNGVSPGSSPSAFVFPMKQAATFPRTTTTSNLLVPGGPNNQPRTPPASPSPNATLGERRFHARRQSELISSKPLSLGNLNQPFKPGSVVTIPSPSKSPSSAPSKDGTSPKFSSQNGLLSPPLESANPDPVPTLEKGVAAPAPPGMAGRRGHAHRRSSAMSMSSADVLNMMLTAAKANNTTASSRGGSAPSSPKAVSESPKKEPMSSVADDVLAPVTDTNMLLEVPQSALTSDSSASSVINVTDEATESARTSIEDTPRKIRVTFSDATEIIPRPASAGTCSTFTTIRGGLGDSVSSLHAYRNSISSMEELQHIDSRGRRASASDASALPRIPRTKTDRRPNSADAATLFRNAQKSSWLFPPLSPKDPFSKSKKGHSKHFSESSATEKPKRKSRKASNPDSVPKTPKKVKGGMKGWAGGILLRRNYKKRGLKHLPRRTPTPPLMHRDEVQRLMMEGSYVLMPTTIADYQPRESSSMEDGEVEPIIDLGAYESDVESYDFPVIDLDAALGPFNTPKSPSRPVSGFESARKRMHSAAGWNCYHRRAESMPEMQLFSLAEDEIEGDGMGDVFEDTEEEDDDDDEEDCEEDGDVTLRAEDLPKPVMPAGLALNWDTDDSEIEELDIVDGVANVRKGIKRKMSRLSEDTDPASESQMSEDGAKMDDSAMSIDALTIPTPTDYQFSPALSTNTQLTKPMSDASGNMSHVSLHHVPSFDQTPVVTPSTTSTSICPPTMPSTPHMSEFLLPPVPHIFQTEDDRITIMSGASIYEDPALLGEPGPEIKMSLSVEDIPGTSHSRSSRFYPFFGASTSHSTMPGVETASTTSGAGPEKTKEKKEKRWSKMLTFWKSKPSTN